MGLKRVDVVPVRGDNYDQLDRDLEEFCTSCMGCAELVGVQQPRERHSQRREVPHLAIRVPMQGAEARRFRVPRPRLRQVRGLEAKPWRR